MKLKKLSLFTGDTTSSPPTTTPSTSPSSSTSSKMTCSDSLLSHHSLQTLPSVPSLQTTFSLLTKTPTLSHSLSTSLSLSSPISSLSLSSDQTLIYVSSLHYIHVYQLPSEKDKMYADLSLSLLETFNANGASHGTVKSVTFCNGKVLSAHQDGKILVWKLTEKKQRCHHKLISTLPTLTDKLTRFPLPKNHVQVRRHKTRLWVEHNDAVSSLAVTEGKILSVSWDKTLKVWGPKTLRCQESVTAHEDAINAVVVSRDGVVYTGSADGRIRVWAGPGPRPGPGHARVATLEKHRSAVNALALNPDGSILFSGACDRSILVWEREDSAKYMVVSGALRGHGGAILCLINVCDFLISGSADRTVRIWRRGFEGKFCCLSVLTGHMKAVKCLAGRMEGDDVISIFSGGLDGEIKVWSVKINFSSSHHEL